MQWLLGVVGVVLLGVLADVLLPNGQMNKYVKGIFAVLLIFVILSPIAAFLRQDVALSSLVDFDTEGYFADTAYIDYIENEQRQALLSQIRTRYGTVYDVQYDKEGRLGVWVAGDVPEGLGEYVCLVTGKDPQEVVLYGGG